MDVSFWEHGQDWIAIVVDSAAEESVCPHVWGKQFGLREAGGEMNLVNASGGKINHYGQRQIVVKIAQSF